MRTLIELYFLPGAAGNFFSRCLNLLDNSYCYARGNTIPTTIEEKYKILNYELVQNRSYNDDNNSLSNDPRRNWVKFEDQITHFEDVLDYSKLPDNATAIWLCHPHKTFDKTVSHPNRIFFYIDSSDAFEWTLLNCLYKDSYLVIEFLLHGKKLKNNPAVHKISLTEIVQDRNSFINEFVRVCAIFDRQVTDIERRYILDLYDQWIKTTLPREKFPEFKDQIGWGL